MNKRAAAQVQPGDEVIYAKRRYAVQNVSPFAGPRAPFPPYFTINLHGQEVPVTYRLCRLAPAPKAEEG